MTARMEKLASRYVGFLIRHYWIVLLIATSLTIVAALSASRFTLKTNFVELLPQDEPSVKDLERAKARKGGLSNLIVAVMGNQPENNRKIVDDLAEKFKELPKEYVTYIKYNIKEERAFYKQFKHLYAGLDDLSEVYERLREKVRYERIKNNPILNMDFDGEELEPVEFDLSDIKEKYENKSSSYDKFIDGYFTGEEGKLYAIMLYPPGAATGIEFGKRMRLAVMQAIAEVCSGSQPKVSGEAALDELILQNCQEKYGSSVTIGIAGSVVTAIDEQKAIIDDLVLVTSICLLFVGLAVLLYFRLWRSLPVVGIPLIMGTTWTFGISIYIVEHLNTSTAFLAAIIVGNGINFGLIQLARFTEERRAGKGISESVTNAMLKTARATSTAALAASIAYGSLIITEFRGFNGFGYMGGLGMVLCWISAFTVQPSLLVMTAKFWPIRFNGKGKGHDMPTGLFARPYARLLFRFGTPMHVVAWLFGAVCIVVAIPYLGDPFEYDFRNLRNQSARLSGSGALSSRVDKIFPRRLNPMFILADRPDQMPLIMAELERRNTQGEHKGLFQDIVSIHTLLPKDQKKKIKILKKIDKLLSKSTLSWLTEEQRREVDEYLPKDGLKSLSIDDLPFGLSKMFTELDGRKGLAIALYPRHGVSVWDGHFLMEIAQASRLVNLPDGEQVTSAGTSTIFADMIKAIERDGPRAVVASLLGVMILVFLAYRNRKYIMLTMVTLIFGVIWTIGPAAIFNLRLNFLNFIALPITFGIGIDYAVNVLTRYRIEGPGSIRKVIGSTGGAVILCSVTTLIGYSSLLIADNQALVSFGILADIGEVASLAAAVLLLPILIQKNEERKARVQLKLSQKQKASA